MFLSIEKLIWSIKSDEPDMSRQLRHGDSHQDLRATETDEQDRELSELDGEGKSDGQQVAV